MSNMPLFAFLLGPRIASQLFATIHFLVSFIILNQTLWTVLLFIPSIAPEIVSLHDLLLKFKLLLPIFTFGFFLIIPNTSTIFQPAPVYSLVKITFLVSRILQVFSLPSNGAMRSCIELLWNLMLYRLRLLQALLLPRKGTGNSPKN